MIWSDRPPREEPFMSRALLVIDVQNEYFTGALPITHPVGHLDQILEVMDAAAGRIPTVVVQHHTEDRPIFRRGPRMGAAPGGRRPAARPADREIVARQLHVPLGVPQRRPPGRSPFECRRHRHRGGIAAVDPGRPGAAPERGLAVFGVDRPALRRSRSGGSRKDGGTDERECCDQDVFITGPCYREVLGFREGWTWGEPPDFGCVRWGKIGVMFALSSGPVVQVAASGTRSSSRGSTHSTTSTAATAPRSARP